MDRGANDMFLADIYPGDWSICFISQEKKKDKRRGGVQRLIKKAQRQRDHLQAQAETLARMTGAATVDTNPVNW